MPEAKSKVIDGDSYMISQPYEAGHVINEIEARVLNQTRAENIGNNVRSTLKELKAQAEAEGWTEKKLTNALVKVVEELDASYVFTAAATRSSAKLDPVEKEARKQARELLKEYLAQTGRKLTVPPEGITEEEWAETIESEVDRIAAIPEVMEAARETVMARQSRTEKMQAVIGKISA
jgi:thiamine monophosphate synthase